MRTASATTGASNARFLRRARVDQDGFAGDETLDTRSAWARARAEELLQSAVLRPDGRTILSEDPMRFRAGMNFYSYVRNRPVSLTDPSGLRIHVQLTEKAAEYDLSSTCTGSVGATCYLRGAYKMALARRRATVMVLTQLCP
jgi:hypothetical protein